MIPFTELERAIFDCLDTRGGMLVRDIKAVMSLLWNYARSIGYTDRPNPCAGVRCLRIRGRSARVLVFVAICESQTVTV